MGLFGKSDELFELMAQRKEGKPIGEDTRRQRRRMMTSSFSLRRPTGGFGPRRVQQSNEPEPEFFEVDGDALIVVDDDWVLGGDEPQGGSPMFAIRSDTMVVGAFLSIGLIAAAFLVGRGSADPENPVQVSVVAEETAEQAKSQEVNPTGVAGALIPGVIGGEAPTSEATTVPRESQATPTRTPAATTLPASAPRAPAAKAKYVLVVCTTRPANARKLAKWLNEAPKSPIFGRSDVQAYATRRGVVRIRGFTNRESQVLGQVKATNDPLGGNGTFHTAYYKRS